VYEIYKVGAWPEWVPGLDLLREAGLAAAVIPHYNNAEGGNHDTRFCYLGEARLRLLEATLPDGSFVLGVDEHTGLVLDLDAGSATVVGLGGVTVRSDGHDEVVPAGTTVAIESLADAARRPSSGFSSGNALDSAPFPLENPTGTAVDGTSPLVAELVRLESEFAAALERRDVPAAAQAVLDLEAALHAWSADTLQSDDLDRGRATLRSMVVRLASVAESGAEDPRSRVAPFVDALLTIRTRARADKRFADADAVRDDLVALGVEVRDGPSGTEWDLGGA
jgi:hypothetical protein